MASEQVPRAEVQPGDLADHVTGWLDPRPVAQIDHAEGLVWLKIGEGVGGPYLIENYNYTRRTP